MTTATPQAVASLLKAGKEELLHDWEIEARKLPGIGKLSPLALRDHLPLILEELAKALELARQSDRAETVFSIHGVQRLEEGVPISQVVEEYKLLRLHVLKYARRAGLKLRDEDDLLIHRLIDDGIRASVEAYVNRRDEREREVRDEYLSFVVHDLRSPLAAIYQTIQLVERGSIGADSERVRPILSGLKRNVERMEALIVKLLEEEENIRSESTLRTHIEKTDLWPIAEIAVRTLMPLAATSATKVSNEIPQEILVRCDKRLLERVFQNLISNAIEYTPNGAVVIGAAMTERGNVECWVKDSGNGIPEELQDKVFDKNFSTRGSRGVGLGLAVVKKILEAHNGAVRLESEVEEGTTVRFWLPGNPV
jgi:two-component system, OmpR family, phosphate regulon sensor histidine kinase PhoR